MGYKVALSKVVFKHKWVYSIMEGKDQMFSLNWDSFCKHISHKKTKKNLGSMKKGEWYQTKNYKYAKNHYKFVSQSH